MQHAFFGLPVELRRRIWAFARRRHLVARAGSLLARREAALFTTPTGSVVARLVVSPAKQMHLSLFMADRRPQRFAPKWSARWFKEGHLSALMEDRGVQGVFEVVTGGRQAEMWWQEGETWKCHSHLAVPCWPGWWSNLVSGRGTCGPV